MSLGGLRKRRSWSQEDLALGAGVDRTTVKKIEGGKARPLPETIRKLAAALGLEPAELAEHLAGAQHSHD